jgi:hypothetical protein
MTDTTMLTRSAKSFFLRALCFTSLALLGGACTKEDSQPEPGLPVLASNDRLLLASTYATGVKDIKYNSDHQPVKFFTTGMEVQVSYDKDQVVYSYFGEKLIEKKVYDIENGLVTNLTEYNYFGDSESKGFASSFTYESGQIIKALLTVEGKPFGHAEYFYDNARKNLTVVKMFDHSGNLLTTTSYEYTDYLDKSGSHNELHRWVDGTLFPKKAKFLVKKSSTEDHFTGKQSVITYEYVLDERGYALSVKATKNGSIFNWTNTWQ